MKKGLLLFLLLIQFRGYSQSVDRYELYSGVLGEPYTTISNISFKILCECGKKMNLYETNHFFATCYCETFEDEDSSRAFWYFVFDKTDSICYKVIRLWSLTTINYTIQYFNNNYVKISEYKWKDYKNNVYLEIEIKDEGKYLVTMYR